MFEKKGEKGIQERTTKSQEEGPSQPVVLVLVLYFNGKSKRRKYRVHDIQ